MHLNPTEAHFYDETSLSISGEVLFPIGESNGVKFTDNGKDCMVEGARICMKMRGAPENTTFCVNSTDSGEWQLSAPSKTIIEVRGFYKIGETELPLTLINCPSKGKH